MKKTLLLSIITANLLFSSDTSNITLDKVEVIATNAQNSFSSSKILTRQQLDKIPAKDHTIAQALKTNPNVIINTQNSVESGEIKPENFSINGAKFYQNNFLVDGVNFNHDLNPANKNLNGHETPYYHVSRAASLSSQSMTLDTDLLESLEVIDNAVSAKYGSFQGGVVKATTRDPSYKFSGVISHQYTSGEWTHTYKDKRLDDGYYKARSGTDKSNFKKHRYRVGLEGYLSENFGILFDYSRQTSVIKYDEVVSTLLNSKLYKIPDDKREVENYFLKAIWHPSDRLTIKPSILYSLQKNRYFEEGTLDSTMDYEYGGYVLNLDADLDLDSVMIKQNLSYSKFDTSRFTNNKIGKYEYKFSSIKNWGGYDPDWGQNTSNYGSVSDVEQLQEEISYKLDLEIKPFKTYEISHKIITGLELSRTKGVYKILKPYEQYYYAKPITDDYICDKDDLTCINDDSFPGANGQFFTYKSYYGDVNNKVTNNKVALYLEDEMSYKRLKFRPGVRVEKDSFDKDILVSPRFVSEYEFSNKNFFGFGLNRYYGRNLFAYKLYGESEKYNKFYYRDHPSKPFELDPWQSPEKYGLNDVKTPYDDEFSLFYRGDIGGARINLKYVKRDSKDEVISINGEYIGLDPYKTYYVNQGSSKAEIYTFSIENIAPVEILNTKNSFSFSITKVDKKTNFTDYTTTKNDPKKKWDYAEFEGSVIPVHELPRFDYDIPLSARFTHSLSYKNFSVTNFLTFTDKVDTLARTGRNKDGLTKYEVTQIPSRTIWDMRLSYKFNLKNDIKFFTNLDINNVLNKKYPINANKNLFGEGRSFWLEAGIRW